MKNTISELTHLRGQRVGQTCVMCKNNNEDKTSIETPSPLYHIHTSTVV